MKSLNFNWVNGVSLVEIWLILGLFAVILLCHWTSWLVLPVLVLAVPALRFAMMLLLAVLFGCLAADGCKDVVLRMMRVAVDQVWQIEAALPETFENTIIIANYPACMTEYLLLPILLGERGLKTCLVTGSTSGLWTGLFLDSDAQIRLKDRGNFTELEQALLKRIGQGRIPVIYPEREVMSRPTHDTLTEFRTGVFRIAEKNKLKILLVRLDHMSLGDRRLKIRAKLFEGTDPVAARAALAVM